VARPTREAIAEGNRLLEWWLDLARPRGSMMRVAARLVAPDRRTLELAHDRLRAALRAGVSGMRFRCPPVARVIGSRCGFIEVQSEGEDRTSAPGPRLRA
jgi:hypothetical protein